MPANFNPIYTLTPNVSSSKITTTSTNARSDGSAAGAIGTDQFVAFTSGPSGSFVQRVRFNPVASAAAVTSVATTLRVFLSSTGSGTPTAANTHLLAEISVPAISAAALTAATNYYEIPLNVAIPASRFILVSQHVAQTTNQSWQATVFGGDY
ncbi:hypothetical protein UFOVP450_198 [uncultured Caudovirales phage]|uniref:Uncharacterized protein n=1 Tax=uncultured Caudovirales phage TaxID=2100421 RepID=A0A6J5MBI9_9CAUD|nr:hypothetical protein UFOVP450_198 [uncultured Caudovirales phage]